MTFRVVPVGVLLAIVVGCSMQPNTASTASESADASRPSPSPSPTTSPEPELGSCDPEAPGPTPAEGQIVVFFRCGSSPLASVVPVARLTDGESVEERLAAAISLLLAGPTSAEEATGITSWFSDATESQLNDVSVDQAGAAVINFADFSAIIPNASTTNGARQLLGEIRATVFQIQRVTSAELQFDGSCADSGAGYKEFALHWSHRVELDTSPTASRRQAARCYSQSVGPPSRSLRPGPAGCSCPVASSTETDPSSPKRIQ